MDATATDFWRIFSRTLGRPFGPTAVRQEDTKEWDSLRHVELMFELEEHFGVQIAPDTIVELFSDTDVVLGYLRAQRAANG